MLDCYDASSSLVHSNPTLLSAFLQRNLQPPNHLFWHTQECGVRCIDMVSHWVAQSLSKALLHSQRDSSVLVAEEIHARHLAPRFMRSRFVERLIRMRLQFGNRLLLRFWRHVVIEYCLLVRGPAVSVIRALYVVHQLRTKGGNRSKMNHSP